ncbi:2-dehydropantoate 2-reductase [Halobacillus mangrovi]|uniref:2-dehydropantoate 2-reductase n=1 Tax=Halobacillus mangrovi TaxID=402384 RepID=UPI003D96A708
MNVGIIGMGSVGMLMAAYLGRDHIVDVYVRNEEQKEKLNLKGIFCDAIGQPVSVNAHLLEEGLPKSYDVLIVAVKQTGIDSLLNNRFPSDTPVLFLQNGMGHIEKLLEKPYPAWVGIVEHGALKQDHCHVLHTGKGIVKIASVTKERNIEKIVSSFNHSDFPVEYEPDYKEMLISKLIVNTVINPLTALFKVNNGHIISNSYLRELAEAVCLEACLTLNRSFHEEWENVLTIAELTSENQSSMFKDLVEGRQTEVDAISGYILNKSRKPLPYHQFLVQGIHALQWERGIRING